MSKYKYNKDYFNKIDTEEKAYWLGFLYADGCINVLNKNGKTHSMSLEITLAETDKEHLDKFALAINTNVPIKQRKNKIKNKEYVSYRLIICSTKMCKDLCDLGCTPNKTFTIRLPNNQIVPREYMKDFLRGFFDGDGCVRKRPDQRGFTISITGVEPMLEDIVNYLINNEIINVIPKIHKDKRSHACSFFIYGDDNSKDFLSYLYNGATIYLDRKFKVYQECLKQVKGRYGVRFDEKSNKYIATISINNHRKVLGYFCNEHDAIVARKMAEVEKMKRLNCRLNQ